MPKTKLSGCGEKKKWRATHITKAIYGGIKKGIQVAVENNCYGSAVILILSGIDSMAFLNMPKLQTDVKKADFTDWVKSSFI
jgi:hypothetical protein